MNRSVAPARLSGPGELAAALPLLCGFHPRESLVAVALTGPRGRVGLTARYDLPDEAEQESVVADVVGRVLAVGARRAWVAVVSEQGAPGLPRRPLVAALRDAVDRAGGLDLQDALLVRDGRWWSYLCHDRTCCPVAGTPLPETSGPLAQVRAESVLQGRVVLGSREQLVASLSAPPLPAVALTRLVDAERRLADLAATGGGQAAVRAHLRGAFAEALDDPAGPAGPRAAELALGLHDLTLRDEVLTWSARRGSALLALLLHLVRATPAPYDAPVCACLAWVAYARGDGATAGIALERALATDPGHSLAGLLADALDRQLPPSQLRSVTRRTASALRRST